MFQIKNIEQKIKNEKYWPMLKGGYKIFSWGVGWY